MEKERVKERGVEKGETNKRMSCAAGGSGGEERDVYMYLSTINLPDIYQQKQSCAVCPSIN
jgi:hypothetical protein